MSTLKDILAAIEAKTQPAQLWALMTGYFRTRGFDKISYHHTSGTAAAAQPVTVAAEGFSDSWVCHYIKQKLYLVDPITDLAQRAIQPFFWRDIPHMVDLTPEQERYLQQMDQARLGNGLAFQVYGPGLRNAYVGLGFAPDMSPPEAPDLFEMQFVAQAAHIRYCTLVPARVQRTALSPRERDVLRWIARGKSNSVIADILGLSPHTIDTLMRRVFRKLDVSDRTAAAIEGIGSGLILP